jgi:sugar phosphate isomerase/epimerase
LKLGCSSWSYHKAIAAGRLTLTDWLDVCGRDLALDGVELLDLHFPTTDAPYLREVRRRCADLYLTISCVSVSNDFGCPTASERDREQLRVKHWVDVAHTLGAPVLRVFAGWPPAGQKDSLWPSMICCLKECAEYAQERGVVLGLENHNRGGFVATADEVERALADVGSPWLRLCLDTGDFENPVAIQRTVGHAVHVHAKLYELDRRGADKRLDWPAIMATLRAAHYRGFLSIEYEGEEETETAIGRGVSYLRGLLRE